MFMVKAGSWLTEFVSQEAGIDVDSSEHESSSRGSLAGLSQVTFFFTDCSSDRLDSRTPFADAEFFFA